MKRLTPILVGVIILLTIGLTLCVRYAGRQRSEKLRLETNQGALLSENIFYKTKDGKEAASVQALTLRCNEYERLMARDAAQIRSLNIKVKNLESVAHAGTSTELKVTAPIRDTIILHNNIREMMRSFNWADTWVSIKGLINADSVACTVNSCDTLTQVVHSIPRKFLFFRWGTKAVRQEIVSSNPHTSLTYTEYIKLQ